MFGALSAGSASVVDHVPEPTSATAGAVVTAGCGELTRHAQIDVDPLPRIIGDPNICGICCWSQTRVIPAGSEPSPWPPGTTTYPAPAICTRYGKSVLST